MPNDALTAIGGLLQIGLTALVTLAGSYLVFRNRWKESSDTVEVARINNQDDMLAAYGNLQAQLAAAAENLIAPLNLQIADQQKRLLQQAAELSELRQYVKQKSNEQEVLTKRVVALEEENRSLRERLDRALAREESLRARLNRIRRDIDTGELPSGTHRVPPKDDE